MSMSEAGAGSSSGSLGVAFGAGVTALLGIMPSFYHAFSRSIEFGTIELPPNASDGGTIKGYITIKNTGGSYSDAIVEMRVQVPVLNQDTGFTRVKNENIGAGDIKTIPTSISLHTIPKSKLPATVTVTLRVRTGASRAISDIATHHITVS